MKEIEVESINLKCFYVQDVYKYKVRAKFFTFCSHTSDQQSFKTANRSKALGSVFKIRSNAKRKKGNQGGGRFPGSGSQDNLNLIDDGDSELRGELNRLQAQFDEQSKFNLCHRCYPCGATLFFSHCMRTLVIKNNPVTYVCRNDH